MKLTESNILFSSFCGASAFIWVTASYHDSSRLQSDKPHCVGLLRARDQSNAETFARQHPTPTRDRNECTRLDSKPQSQANIRPLSHDLDRPATEIVSSNM